MQSSTTVVYQPGWVSLAGIYWQFCTSNLYVVPSLLLSTSGTASIYKRLRGLTEFLVGGPKTDRPTDQSIKKLSQSTTLVGIHANFVIGPLSSPVCVKLGIGIFANAVGMCNSRFGMHNS